MKKIILTAGMLVTLSACNTLTHKSGNQTTQPYMVAGSDARKTYCRHKNTHTVRDYHDCVKGSGAQHTQYAVGVVHPEKTSKE